MTQTQQFETETRTFSWATPGQDDLSRLLELDGLQQLQAMRSGEMPPPPIMDTLGFTDLRPEPGRVVVEMPAAEFHYNPLGTVHGGWTATVIDSALGCAVHSTLGPGEIYTTLDLQVRFVKAILAGTGRLRAEATVVHVGKRTATAEARLVGPDGTLYATATASCLVTR